MGPDDHRAGLGALIGALILSIASLAFVVWIVAVSSGDHALFASTSPGELDVDVASSTRPSS